MPRYYRRTINLQSIVQSFPFLEQLHPENVVHDGSEISSINDLSRLMDLTLGTSDWSVSKFPPSLMPIKSVEWLTRLKIDSRLDTSQASHLLITYLHSFVNPSEEIMCDFLIRTTIKLQTLKIVIDDSYILTSEYNDIFYGESLRNLEKLALTFETWSQSMKSTN